MWHAAVVHRVGPSTVWAIGADRLFTSFSSDAGGWWLIAPRTADRDPPPPPFAAELRGEVAFAPGVGSAKRRQDRLLVQPDKHKEVRFVEVSALRRAVERRDYSPAVRWTDDLRSAAQYAGRIVRPGAQVVGVRLLDSAGASLGPPVDVPLTALRPWGDAGAAAHP
eukprot:gene1669-7385_t